MKTKATYPFLVTLACCIFFIQPISSANNEFLENEVHSREEFDPSYFHRFQSVESIIHDADQQFGKGNKSLAYYNHVAKILRNRFYHGYSHYKFSENALAYFSGFAWNHLSALVMPEDIMKHPNAACSQQAIVLMEIFKRNQIDFRKVILENHFVVEGYIENEWRYFDTNLEPDIMQNRKSFQYMVETNGLQEAYKDKKISCDLIKRWSRDYSFGVVNEIPGWNARLFHQLGFWFQGQFLFIVFLCGAFTLMYYRSKINPGLKGLHNI